MLRIQALAAGLTLISAGNTVVESEHSSPIEMIIVVEVPPECVCPATSTTQATNQVPNCDVGPVTYPCVAIWFTDGTGSNVPGACVETDVEEPVCEGPAQDCQFKDIVITMEYLDVCSPLLSCCSTGIVVRDPTGAVHATLAVGDTTTYTIDPPAAACATDDQVFDMRAHCRTKLMAEARVTYECGQCTQLGG